MRAAWAASHASRSDSAFGAVEHQVENAGGVMPAFKGTLSDTAIHDVAGYVASTAGP